MTKISNRQLWWLLISVAVIWFANLALGSNGTGTLANPFNTLAAANTALGSNTNQRIFLFSGTAASGTNVTLAASDWLVGQGVTGASFDAVMGISPPLGTIARDVQTGDFLAEPFHRVRESDRRQVELAVAELQAMLGPLAG